MVLAFGMGVEAENGITRTWGVGWDRETSKSGCVGGQGRQVIVELRVKEGIRRFGCGLGGKVE